MPLCAFAPWRELKARFVFEPRRQGAKKTIIYLRQPRRNGGGDVSSLQICTLQLCKFTLDIDTLPRQMAGFTEFTG
jgi:hypothetical protein